MAEEPKSKDIQRLQAVQKRLDDAREASKALTTERNDLKKRLVEAEKALEKAQGEAEARRGEGEVLYTALKAILLELGVKPQPQSSITVLMEALQKELSALHERLRAAEQRAVRLEAALKEAEERASAAEQRAAEAEQMLKQFREQLVALQQQIKEQVHAAEARAAQAESALAEAQATIKALEGGEEIINDLIGENRRMAEQLDSFTGDLERLKTSAEESSIAARTASAEAAVANKARAAVEKKLAAAQAQQDKLASQLVLLNKQITDAGKTPFLTADQVAGMLDGFIEQLNLSTGGLAIRNGDIRLKVGFGAAGEAVGFVIPTTETAASIKDSLHEVTLHFERGLDDSIKAGLSD